MHLGPTVTEFGLDDRPWLGSSHGTQATESITVDLALFTKATHYPEGVLLSGIPLAQVSTTKFWGPYKGDATDGRQTLVGHLYSTIHVVDGVTRYIGAVFVHGKVRLNRLPAGIRPDAAGQADVAGSIRYINQ